MQTTSIQSFQDFFLKNGDFVITSSIKLSWTNYLVCLAVSEILKYNKVRYSLLGIVVFLVHDEVSLSRLVLLTTITCAAIIGSHKKLNSPVFKHW